MKKTNAFVILGLIAVVILAVLFTNGTFSILGEGDVVYDTDADGNRFPVKVTYDFACEEVQDCRNFLLSNGASSSELDEVSLSCNGQCVVDFR